jgi:twinkle protein
MDDTLSESVVVGREACPKCRANGNDNSGDNLARYSDGGAFCFACQYFERGDGTVSEQPAKQSDFKVYRGQIQALDHRRIDTKPCRVYGYQTANIRDKDIEIANYFKDGVLVAQHMRGPDKTFHWVGSPRGCELFGQHLWGNGGKKLVITEGEIDCLSVAQMQDCKWPAVSLPNGAAGAVRDIKNNLEFVNSFDEVILMFDMDEPGQAAAKSVADILPPGKAKIASLPYKDANECLVQGSSRAIIDAIWQARVYSPDEILHVSSIVERSTETVNTKVWPFPFKSLTRFLTGQRSGEITLYASGTGSGKSTFLRELSYHHLRQGRSVGMIMLEESPEETMDDMISLIINKPVRKIRSTRMMNELLDQMGEQKIDMDIIDDLSDEEYAKAKRELGETGLYIYDHLGNNAMANLMARMEYMAVSLGVDVIMLDHITAAAAGLMNTSNKDIEGGGSERLIIDAMMRDMRSLCVRTGVHIDVVSQLKKTDKAFEEGSRITMQDLRGSGALASVPNTVVALERDRQAPDARQANTTTVRVLKNRLDGRAGVASAIYFNHESGRMEETDFVVGDDGKVGFKPEQEGTF